MPRKEGPFAHGEGISPLKEQRLAFVAQEAERARSSLEAFFGPDVVDTEVRRRELRDQALRRRLAATVEFMPTPQTLAHDRKVEFGAHGDNADQSVSSVPLSGLVDLPTEPFSTPQEAQPVAPPINRGDVELVG